MVKEVTNHFRSILTPEGGVPRRAEFIHNNNNMAADTESEKGSLLMMLFDRTLSLEKSSMLESVEACGHV